MSETLHTTRMAERVFARLCLISTMLLYACASVVAGAVVAPAPVIGPVDQPANESSQAIDTSEDLVFDASVPAEPAGVAAIEEPRGVHFGRSDRPIGELPSRVAPSQDPTSQSAGESSASQAWMSDTAFALLAVLAVLGVIYVGMRSVMSGRSGGLGGRAPSPAGLLEILGRYPVGRGVTLILLRLDRRVLLISQSSGGRLSGGTMTTLAELTDAEDVASVLTKVRDADGDSLAERFKGMLAGYESSHENAVPEPHIGRELDVQESDADIRVLRSSLRSRGGRA